MFQMLCLYRHSLLWAAGERRLLASAFRARFQLSATVAHKLLKNLHSKGVLRGNLDE